VSKRLPLLLLPCLLFLAGFAFAACGGGDDETSKVEETIETAATTTDPAECSKTQTQNFMEQTSQASGKAAVKKCEEEAEKEEGAESAKVSNVEVDGSSASAEVALGGNIFDGQTLEVALVKDGDQWKLDEVVKFTEFDHGKFVKTFEGEIEKSGEANSKFATCFLEAFEEADQREVEELLFNSAGKGFEEIAKNCA
jgi:hypothetical protein